MAAESNANLDALCQEAEQLTAIGDYEAAASLYEQILAIQPDFRTGYWHLGLMYLLQKQEEEAQFTWMLPFTELAPDSETEAQWTAELLTALQTAAQTQTDRQQFWQAWTIHQHIHQINPTNLNNLLRLLELDLEIRAFQIEDLDEYGLISQLQQQDNVPIDRLLMILEQMLERIPDHPVSLEFAVVCLPYLSDLETWIDRFLTIGQRLALKGDYAEACQYSELCLQLNPEHAHTLGTLSRFYQDSGQYEKGLELAERQFQLFEQLPEKILSAALLVRANLLMAGRWTAAEAALHQLTELLETWLAETEVPTNTLLSPLILCSPMFLYPYFSDYPQQARSLQNKIASSYTKNVKAFTKSYIKDCKFDEAGQFADRSKLRIGYLCHCFRRHSVGWLSRWIFEHFDRDRFEIYAYFVLEEELTAFGQRWFAENATQHRLCGADAFEIARTIQADGIDILVDLDSLTMDVTCNVMALKPAPIQVTWLGLDASGIPTIDYFIADPYVLPDHAQDYYTERVWRLPQTYLAVDGFEVGVPTLKRDSLNIPNDAIVYFSSQTGQKRNPDNIRQQLKIIRSVPNSYFLIKGLGSEAAKQNLFCQLAQEEGVSIDRLRFLANSPNEETHRANLSIADIVLDTFPYNGATTTMEALWMGISLVTRVGEQFAARNSYTMMINAGITKGIAWTDQEYVEWGIRLGSNPILRQEITWQLQQSRQTAPLWNAKQFTRQLEKAYMQMWEHLINNKSRG